MQPRVALTIGPVGGEIRAFDLPRPMTIQEVIDAEELRFRLPTIAIFSSGDTTVPVLRKDWKTHVIGENEGLSFVTLPGGGGGDGQGKQIIGLLASIALAVAAPMIAGALFTGLAASIASAAIVAGGSLLLGVLFGGVPQTPPSSDGDEVYSVSASGNRATPLAPIPVLYGRLRFPPPLGARGYYEYEGNDQYLYQLHVISLGEAVVERFEIGDTLVWTALDGFTESFEDIEMEIILPGEDIELFPINVVAADTVSNQIVPSPPGSLGPFSVNGAGTQISRISIDFAFPAGLYTGGGSGGSISNASRRLVAEYREIDNDGDPLGSWEELFDETFTLSARTIQRYTRSGTVTPGRYEVRFSSVDNDTTDGQTVINRVIWAGLRGHLTNWEVPPNVTMVATKIRANDQLSSISSSQYFFTAQRKLPVYDTDTELWSAPVATSNIAWAVADVLRNTDYGLSISEDLYDLNWLAAYAEVWEEREDEFNAIFDRSWVAQEALSAMLRCGRSSLVRVAGLISFNRDEVKTVRRMVFTGRNIVRGSMSRRNIMFDEKSPDHVTASFISRETWNEETVRATMSAYTEETEAQQSYFGITDHDHAWREAIFDAACNAYRRSFRSFTAEMEGKLLTRGDPISLHDTLTEQVAPLCGIVGHSGATLTLDEDLVPDPEETEFYAFIRDKTGREWGPCLISSFPAANQVILDSADLISVQGQHGNLDDILPGERREKAHFALLAGDTRLFDGLVVSTSNNGDGMWSINVVVDDQRVHLADETETTPAPYTPPSMYSPPPEAPVVTGLYLNARNNTLHIEVEAGWNPAPGAFRYTAEISYDTDAHLNPGDVAWSTIYEGIGTRFTGTIIPQPFTIRVAGIGVRQGPWIYAVQATVPEAVLAPGTVSEESLNDALDALMQNIMNTLPTSILQMKGELESLAATVNTQVTVLRESIGQVNIGAGARYGEAMASAETAFTAAATANSAIAAILSSVYAVTDAGTAEATFRIIASSLPEGALAAIQFQLRAGLDQDWANAAMEIAVFYNEELGTHSRVRFTADAMDFIDNDGNVSPLNLAVISLAESTPIVSNKIEVDLRKRRTMYVTNITDDAEIQFPTGAYVGATWKQVFIGQGGSHDITFDLQSYMVGDDPPVIPSTNGVYTICEGTVILLSPPVADFQIERSGATNLTSLRRFIIEPAIEGRTMWDLDIHGPCTIPIGTYTITPVNTYLDCTVELWGPGGSSGALVNANVSWSMTQPGAGTATTFAGMSAGAGGTSASLRTPGGGDSFGSGGSAGTASGGDINTNGNAGGAGSDGGFSADAYSGQGAAAPDGGAATARYYASAYGNKKQGDPGNSPGGGAGGSSFRRPYSGNTDQLASGGGGSGAKVEKEFSTGDLLQNTPYTLIVGDSGAAGTSEDGFVGNIVQGAKGAPGLAVIT